MVDTMTNLAIRGKLISKPTLDPTSPTKAVETKRVPVESTTRSKDFLLTTRLLLTAPTKPHFKMRKCKGIATELCNMASLKPVIAAPTPREALNLATRDTSKASQGGKVPTNIKRRTTSNLRMPSNVTSKSTLPRRTTNDPERGVGRPKNFIIFLT